MDSYRGDPNDPLSLNLYTYCANNPIYYIDPTGHSFLPTKEELDRLFFDAQSVIIGFDQAHTGGILTKFGQAVNALFGNDNYATDEYIAYQIENNRAFKEGYEMGQVLGLLNMMHGNMNNTGNQYSFVTANGTVIDSTVLTQIKLPGILFAQSGDDESVQSDLPSRNGALNKAKRDAGVPKSQGPDKIEIVPMRGPEHAGSHVMKDSNGNVIYTREYYFTNTDGVQLIIQEHSAGHSTGGQGPHFNVRPTNNPRNGTFPGTLGHYPFK